ncbi:uncharacterized protein LOC114726420 [Neltuma alba]|uniref:uncharacterized protein LOC114726420 n=1 Tax=Neltuma alba TaxID=207710 RepID=UPI0010A47B9D|nr:uncharacterized protein LOC114726420 [Prosopis alba]
MQQKYKWLPQYDHAIKKIWNAKCAKILRNTMPTVRQDLYKKQVRAKRIPRQVMTELERIWASEDYKAKCEIVKANRASTTGGTQHKGRSIPNTEHKRRLALELERDPSMFELFKRTHLNDKTGKFTDQRAELAHVSICF